MSSEVGDIPNFDFVDQSFEAIDSVEMLEINVLYYSWSPEPEP